jgi:hypothetical protein
VVPDSSSFEILSRGGGIYKDIWAKAQRRKDWMMVDEDQGMARVLADPNFAFMSSRELIKFEMMVKGKDKFHISSEVFFPKYKAVALRNGSPFRKTFDPTLLRLFDFGILDKITNVSGSLLFLYSLMTGFYRTSTTG